MRVLVAEDNELEADLLRYALEEFGYEVTVARDGAHAFDLVRTGRYRLVVSDWEMPGMTGVELCQAIRGRSTSGYIYVVLLTCRSGPHSVVEGLNAGADDFLSKPFQVQELYVRLRAGERLLSLESRDVTIFSLAKLADSRDPETGAHLERIREYSRLIAEHLAASPKYAGQVDGDYAQLIYLTAPLHDIGKVGVPDRVLLKPGPLTPEEFQVMKQHAVVGGQTLDAAARAHPEAAYLKMAREIAWTHHEKYDGSGYPKGLLGDQIPLCGRIVAVADVYDALTTKRVYKQAYSHEKATRILLEGRGRHFDPDMIDAFLALEARFLAVRDQLTREDERDFQLRPADAEPVMAGQAAG